MLRLAALAAAVGLIFNSYGNRLISVAGFGVVSALLIDVMLPLAGPGMIKAGFSGRDILKKDKPLLPETLGLIVGVIYLFTLLVFIPVAFYPYFNGAEDDNAPALGFPHHKLAAYLSAVLSIESMLMLGVADDLFDLRWRHKFFLPAIAAIPMLIVYYVNWGVTSIVIPPFLNMGTTIDLGLFYYVYMGAVSIFCTNCINIYAGVNGLEVGQSVVLGICVLINDLIYITGPPAPVVENHLLSAYIIIPFVLSSLPLLRYNWWPARGFVGDTYCYFAGMVFAVVGILGHFSKTLLSFCGPQIFNFLYSVPQLFHIVPCPRHRMPVLNEKTGKLEPSRADVSQCRAPVKFVLRVLAKLRLIKIWDEKDGKVFVSNMTLINLTLVHLGPLREDHLTSALLALQLIWGLLAITLRHQLARLVFGG